MAVFHFTCHCKGSACHNEGNVTRTDDVSMTTGICPVFLICVELLHGIRSSCKATQPLRRTSVHPGGTREVASLTCSAVILLFIFFSLFFNSRRIKAYLFIIYLLVIHQILVYSLSFSLRVSKSQTSRRSRVVSP